MGIEIKTGKLFKSAITSLMDYQVVPNEYIMNRG